MIFSYLSDRWSRGGFHAPWPEPSDVGHGVEKSVSSEKSSVAPLSAHGLPPMARLPIGQGLFLLPRL